MSEARRAAAEAGSFPQARRGGQRHGRGRPPPACCSEQLPRPSPSPWPPRRGSWNARPLSSVSRSVRPPARSGGALPVGRALAQDDAASRKPGTTAARMWPFIQVALANLTTEQSDGQQRRLRPLRRTAMAYSLSTLVVCSRLGLGVTLSEPRACPCQAATADRAATWQYRRAAPGTRRFHCTPSAVAQSSDLSPQ